MAHAENFIAARLNSHLPEVTKHIGIVSPVKKAIPEECKMRRLERFCLSPNSSAAKTMVSSSGESSWRDYPPALRC